ncbi:hypothetical protein ES708_15079 [subsurface metagenome]
MGILPGSLQAPVAVQKQGAGDRGEVKIEEGIDEQFIPEDMSAICLAVQTPGGHAGIDVTIVGTRRT